MNTASRAAGIPAELRRRLDCTANEIRAQCALLADELVAKNRSYGDSALTPVHIFAQGDAEQLLRVQIDHKLSRIATDPDAFGEDSLGDLIGYLVLLKIARARKARAFS